MKCTNNRVRLILPFVIAVIILIGGCGSKKLTLSYDSSAQTDSFENSAMDSVRGFAENLCIVNDNVIPEGMPGLEETAGLFKPSSREVFYAYNIHEKRYPASLTKIMTALVLLRHYSGDFSDVITVGDVSFKEGGVQLCGFKKGDKITLEQALNGLLVYSGNDAAVIISQFVAGTTEEFVKLMNEEVIKLGATHTHFTNPHGLHNDMHYTTAYDLYLMFQEALKYDKFREIITKKSYECEYSNAKGATVKKTFSSTNLYLTGEEQNNSGAAVFGGKTGTTSAAGSCLILLVQNAKQEDFISIVMKAADKTELYSEMSELLTLAAKN